MEKPAVKVTAKEKSVFDIVYETLGPTNWENIDLLVLMTTYQGFDPKAMAQSLMAISGTNIKEDVKKMVAFALERGSAIDKIIKKSTREAQNELKILRDRYSLKANARQDPLAVTLPRVCLCFPWVACTYFMNTKSSTSPVPLEDLSDKYPECMKTAAFASMIPTQKSYTSDLAQAFMLHQYRFSLIIQKTKKTFTEMMSELNTYTNAGINNGYVPNERRVTFLQSWGILSKEETLAIEVMWAKEAMKRIVENGG